MEIHRKYLAKTVDLRNASRTILWARKDRLWLYCIANNGIRLGGLENLWYNCYLIRRGTSEQTLTWAVFRSSPHFFPVHFVSARNSQATFFGWANFPCMYRRFSLRSFNASILSFLRPRHQRSVCYSSLCPNCLMSNAVRRAQATQVVPLTRCCNLSFLATKNSRIAWLVKAILSYQKNFS